jgi:hypothetical protein
MLLFAEKKGSDQREDEGIARTRASLQQGSIIETNLSGITTFF